MARLTSSVNRLLTSNSSRVRIDIADRYIALTSPPHLEALSEPLRENQLPITGILESQVHGRNVSNRQAEDEWFGG